MSYGLECFKDDGSQLFHTENICYGLVKSAPLDTIYQRWGRHFLRSAQLPPSLESSWQYSGANDPIISLNVNNAISPIVFITGTGTPCGEVVSGSTTTFLFHGVLPGSKAYVFDLMRDRGENFGLQCFNESGQLTFTSAQPPLNVVAVVSPPAIAAPGWTPAGSPAYVGASNIGRRPYSGSDYLWTFSEVFVAAGVSGETAARLTFSRSGGVYQGVSQYSQSILGAAEGCGGAQGGVKFYFLQAVATTSREQGGGWGSTTWIDIPSDRIPQASVIRTADYPYPYG